MNSPRPILNSRHFPLLTNTILSWVMNCQETIKDNESYSQTNENFAIDSKELTPFTKSRHDNSHYLPSLSRRSILQRPCPNLPTSISLNRQNVSRPLRTGLPIMRWCRQPLLILISELSVLTILEWNRECYCGWWWDCCCRCLFFEGWRWVSYSFEGDDELVWFSPWNEITIHVVKKRRSKSSSICSRALTLSRHVHESWMVEILFQKICQRDSVLSCSR